MTSSSQHPQRRQAGALLLLLGVVLGLAPHVHAVDLATSAAIHAQDPEAQGTNPCNACRVQQTPTLLCQAMVSHRLAEGEASLLLPDDDPLPVCFAAAPLPARGPPSCC